MSLRDLIVDRIRAGGPITVAEYVDLALYHPTLGYYTSALRRSGRAGDFFTSVDVGPLFGEMLAVQLDEMWRLAGMPPRFDLVEAGAGNGRLARDVLDAAHRDTPAFYEAVALHLVERSAAARAGHPDTLGPHAGKLASSGDTCPVGVRGVIFANELLDALPPHQVVMRKDGLREVYVSERDGALVAVEGPLSTSELARYLARVGAELQPGCTAEVNLAADAWMREAARRLDRGFLIVIDYGHDAAELFSAARASGTLRTFSRHATAPGDRAWLDEPGRSDITADVDLTAIRLAAEAAGLTTLAALDQTYFLIGLGIAERGSREAGEPLAALRRRLAAKTLLLPGGMGSSHKVLIFGKGVGTPALACTSFATRMT